MMLRTKSGSINYKVIDKATGKSSYVSQHKLVSKKQRRLLATKPDVIWQFVQRLKKQHQEEGKDVEIYALNSKVSINGGKFKAFIDPKIDLAKVKWSTFKHSNWILEEDELKNLKVHKQNPLKK
jgi:hypothetical protein